MTCSSWVISPEIHHIALDDDLLLCENAFWIGSSFVETIPVVKPSQPITSCDTTKSLKMCGRLRLSKHSRHVVVPLPLK